MSVTTISGLNPQIGKNHLINGEMRVSQRGASFTSTDSLNNDDVYTLDRWNLVSEGNDIVDVTQSTTVPTGGALKSIALDVETANKQFGIIQILEANNCTGLIGNEVTFSFKAKVSNVALGDVRAGIIAWSSTADSVTSDIIATYNDDANPTLASNLTFENTPSDLGVTTSWATYSVTATIDTGSTTNVVVWIGSVDSATTTGHFLYITDCQLEIGPNKTLFERENYIVTLNKCQRYFERIMMNANSQIAPGFNKSTTASVGAIRFAQQKRAVPTAAFSATSAHFRVWHTTTATDTTNIAIDVANEDIVNLVATVSSGLTAGQGSSIGSRNSDGAYLDISSEL